MKKLFVVFVSIFLLAIVIGVVFSMIVESSPVDVSSSGGKIALIPVKGEIFSESSNNLLSYDSASANRIIPLLDKANSDPSIKAIFLDINTPGGSVVASSRIEKKLSLIEKPIVVWMDETATSGGYYVASAADYIYADENTITGSIGVVSSFINVEELFRTIGVKMNIMTSGDHKSMGSPYSSMDEEEKQLFQEVLDEMHTNFKESIIRNREGKISREIVEEVADGRIILATKAVELGLIDAVGTKEQSVMKAAELAGITGKPILVDYSVRPISFSDFFMNAGTSFAKGMMTEITTSASASSGLSIK
ncbi:MAG: signal peptide peptidase SppA [Candidatus Diapherotrites archaeon]|nr:signal peptide peptidase SppA [Candidatus Diapherotrites archaeon]